MNVRIEIPLWNRDPEDYDHITESSGALIIEANEKGFTSLRSSGDSTDTIVRSEDLKKAINIL